MFNRFAQRSLPSRYHPLWVVRAGGDDGELRPWHYKYVYSIESRLIMTVRNKHMTHDPQHTTLNLDPKLSTID